MGQDTPPARHLQSARYWLCDMFGSIPKRLCAPVMCASSMSCASSAGLGCLLMLVTVTLGGAAPEKKGGRVARAGGVGGGVSITYMPGETPVRPVDASLDIELPAS